MFPAEIQDSFEISSNQGTKRMLTDTFSEHSIIIYKIRVLYSLCKSRERVMASLPLLILAI